MLTELHSPDKILQILHSRIYDKTNKRFGWKPHPGQVRVGKALFVDGKKRLFVQCGRKWGKTEFVIYTLLRWAALHPNSVCAYFGPKRNLARSIIWKRLQTFIPKEFLKDNSMGAFKEQALAVRLWNGSEIVIDGTTDEDSGRGVEPHIVVYDEYKDHKPGFRASMEPNLAVYDAAEIFIGTPPDHECEFTEMSEEVKTDPNGYYIEAPSSEGPIYGSEEGLLKLKKLRDKHIKRGELAAFIREYEAKFVLGGAGAVFPMWTSGKEKIVQPEQAIKELIHKDLSKLEWYVITDPGTTTCHATLLVAINPYNKHFYVLDEIYEKNPEQTSTRRIWPRIEGLMRKWNPNLPVLDFKWYKGYDEAAAWFAMEVNDSFGAVGLTPTNKKLTDKENGLSLIKDQMLEGHLTVSDGCAALIWEIERYVKDKNGQIPKKDDHLIDVWRYINSAAGYQFTAKERDKDPAAERGWRGISPHDDLYDMEDFFEP